MWRAATVLDRTALDAGNKAANNIFKVPVFVKLIFHVTEDAENYKNNEQETNHIILNALKKLKRLMR